MLVKFWKANKDLKKEWALDQVPRVGEHVCLDGYVSGHVIALDWHFADELGFVASPPYVTVLLS